MIGIELDGAFRQSTTPFPVAAVGDLDSEIGAGQSIHRVEGEGALRCCTESSQFMVEEQGRGQYGVSEMVGWGCIDGSASRA
jgi:hypothetical protein